ncbi:MOSC domain-containing protein [Marinihelvus fidelis]|nr:hypothetical protein [Marinihelvus fidelis]
MADLVAGLGIIRESPADLGTIELIVRRPETNKREVLDRAELDLDRGLVGDNWLVRGSRATQDGSAHPGMQLNLMNARVIELIAGPRENWPLAGDQFYVDLDLSADNLPPGSRLSLGDAMIEVTDIPHLGCRKFIDRFGLDAAKFVNSEEGKLLNLRGINAKVIKPGCVNTGGIIEKL